MVKNLLVVVVFAVLLPSFAFSLPRLTRASENSYSERDRQIVDELSSATGLTVDELHAFRRAREEASLAARPQVVHSAPAFQAPFVNESPDISPSNVVPSILDINRDFLPYLIEGDILPTKGDIERTTQSRNKRGAPVNTYRWDKTKPIPYFFDPNYPESYYALVEKAMELLTNYSCISFKRNDAKDFGLIIAAHELFHALGSNHEQTRYDRDNYVTVDINAINQTYIFNFMQYTNESNNNYGVPYDYGSMMQYPAVAFPKTGVTSYTIIPKDLQFVNTMGQRQVAGFTDLKQLNLMYSCADACPILPVCENGGFPNSRACGRCICADFFTGDNCGVVVDPREVTQSEKNVIVWSTPLNLNERYNSDVRNFDAYSKRQPTIISGPKGSRLKLTIYVGVNTTSVDPECYEKNQCFNDGVELVDGVDWTLGGKRFCCSQSKNTIHTIETSSNRVGVRAWSAPGWPIKVTISVDVISAPATTSTTTPSSPTSITTTTAAPGSCVSCENDGFPDPADGCRCVCPIFFKGTTCAEPVYLSMVPAPGKPGVTVKLNNKRDNYGVEPKTFFHAIYESPPGSRLRFNIFPCRTDSDACHDDCHDYGIEFFDDKDWAHGVEKFCCNAKGVREIESTANRAGIRAYISRNMAIDFNYTIVAF